MERLPYHHPSYPMLRNLSCYVVRTVQDQHYLRQSPEGQEVWGGGDRRTQDTSRKDVWTCLQPAQNVWDCLVHGPVDAGTYEDFLLYLFVGFRKSGEDIFVLFWLYSYLREHPTTFSYRVYLFFKAQCEKETPLRIGSRCHALTNRS